MKINIYILYILLLQYCCCYCFCCWSYVYIFHPFFSLSLIIFLYLAIFISNVFVFLLFNSECMRLFFVSSRFISFVQFASLPIFHLPRKCTEHLFCCKSQVVYRIWMMRKKINICCCFSLHDSIWWAYATIHTLAILSFIQCNGQKNDLMCVCADFIIPTK